MKTIRTVLITLAVLAAVALGVCYGGIFNMAADDHHWGVTAGMIETMRERNVARQAGDVVVPNNLSDDKLIANGASEYAEMCTGCHLAPGMKDTEMRKGLYPMPPNLAEQGARRPAAEQFWIVKHGLKMTGMPAWGLTHDDERIWSMVAFLQKLPSLSPNQYRALTASGEGHHHHEGMEEHEEGHGEGSEEHQHGHSDGDHADHGHDAAGGPESSEPAEHSHDHASKAVATALPAGAADAVAVVDQFQQLLAKGNTTAAAELFDPAVLIFESGGAERSRAEYASHHLNEDAAFMKTAKLSPLSRTGDVSGDMAFVATESSLKSSGAKPVDLVTTETMVLKRTSQGWRVAHVHWSSKKVK
jgi:ketosteroid isomerase-like protein/mono/diheme cytochrome c family protein